MARSSSETDGKRRLGGGGRAGGGRCSFQVVSGRFLRRSEVMFGVQKQRDRSMLDGIWGHAEVSVLVLAAWLAWSPLGINSPPIAIMLVTLRPHSTAGGGGEVSGCLLSRPWLRCGWPGGTGRGHRAGWSGGVIEIRKDKHLKDQG